jgi:hypothetical protein
MDGFPDAEVERDFHARLLLVVGLGNLDLDGDSFRVGVHVAEIGDAVGPPQEADELVGETGITQSDEHSLLLSVTAGRSTSLDLPAARLVSSRGGPDVAGRARL